MGRTSGLKDAMIELHLAFTANGYKATVLLEELELPYRVVPCDLTKGEHLSPEFLAMNPMGRIPVLVDPVSTGESPITVYGTAAIALYLAEKVGRLLPTDPRERAAAYEWVGIASSDIGPAYSGQFAFEVMAREKSEWGIAFYRGLCDRFLTVMNTRLASVPYLAGSEFSIADVLAYPIAAISAKRYPGNLDAYRAISRWASEVAARPGVQRGMSVSSP